MTSHVQLLLMILSLAGFRYDQKTETWAVYSQLDFKLSEHWSLHSSLRYTDEEKEYRNGSFLLPAFSPPNDVFFANLNSDYKLDRKVSGKISLDFMTRNDLLFYASVSRGFKAGGFFGGFPFDPIEIEDYKEETVWAYELGMKSQWLDRRLRINAALFYYDYRDAQGPLAEVNPLTGSSTDQLGSLGDAEHSGAELEMTWLPTAGLTINANIAYLDAEITDGDALTTNIVGERVSVEGARAYAPFWSLNGSVQYRSHIYGNTDLIYAVDYNYRSDFAGTLTSEVDKAVKSLTGYGLFNGSIKMQSANSHWSATLWGKNLGDKKYNSRKVFDALGSFVEIFGEPKSWGVEVNSIW